MKVVFRDDLVQYFGVAPSLLIELRVPGSGCGSAMKWDVKKGDVLFVLSDLRPMCCSSSSCK